MKLFLPESFSWWHFGGTATQVDSEGEFLAGYAAYRQRQMEGLAQVLRGRNLFSSARARFNLKNLSSELTGVADELGKVSKGKYRSNQVEIEQSQSLARNAIEEYEKEESRENGQIELQIDNRDRLRQSLDTQRHQLSRNEVTRLQGNFKATQQKKQANAPGYDTKWFDQNKLSADHFKSKDVDAGLESLKKNRLSGVVGKRSKSNSEQESRARDRRAAQNVFQRPAQAQTAQEKPQTRSPGDRPAVDQVQRADTGQTLKEAYTDKLELNQQMLPAGGQAAQMPQLGTDLQMEGRDESNTFTTGHSRFVSGLASLDYEIPERGNVFFFTTPRGDVQITGRGVKEDSVRQSVGLIGVVLLAGFLWLAFAVARRWNPGCA